MRSLASELEEFSAGVAGPAASAMGILMSEGYYRYASDVSIAITSTQSWSNAWKASTNARALILDQVEAVSLGAWPAPGLTSWDVEWAFESPFAAPHPPATADELSTVEQLDKLEDFKIRLQNPTLRPQVRAQMEEEQRVLLESMGKSDWQDIAYLVAGIDGQAAKQACRQGDCQHAAP